MKKQRKSAAGQAAHADVYQIVTDRIIATLEQGTAPWRRPWRCVDTGDPGGLPSNALTGRCYSGVNVLLLWLAAEEGGYRCTDGSTLSEPGVLSPGDGHHRHASDVAV